MSTPRKNNYNYFYSKELLISESTVAIHKVVHQSIENIVAKNYNAIEENFEIRKMFKKMFKVVNSFPIYQLKKYYPEIYNALFSKEVYQCKNLFKENIKRGIQQDLYRKDLNYENYIYFYYPLIYGINSIANSDKEATNLELDTIDYHARLIVTPKGIFELEKQMRHLKV